MHEAQPAAQAPAEQVAIPRRHQESPTRESRSRPDQSLQTIIVFRDGVRKECDAGAISGYLAEMLDDPSRPQLDRIFKLPAAVVAVDPNTERVACRNVGFERRPPLVAGKTQPQRLAL